MVKVPLCVALLYGLGIYLPRGASSVLQLDRSVPGHGRIVVKRS